MDTNTAELDPTIPPTTASTETSNPDPAIPAGAIAAATTQERVQEHILQFFAWAHLPPHLSAVSQPFENLARNIVESLPRNPERTVALRKLLEAKDAAVRAMLAK